jgi:Protein of unknown function (DUF3179)
MENVPKALAIAGAATVVVLFGAFLWRQSQLEVETVTVTSDDAATQDFKIVTLLGFDAIPAIDDPKFVSAGEGATQLRPDDLVIGVVVNGEARAYGVAFLSRHEIVNDTVGGRPIAVTW